MRHRLILLGEQVRQDGEFADWLEVSIGLQVDNERRGVLLKIAGEQPPGFIGNPVGRIHTVRSRVQRTSKGERHDVAGSRPPSGVKIDLGLVTPDENTIVSLRVFADERACRRRSALWEKPSPVKIREGEDS